MGIKSASEFTILGANVRGWGAILKRKKMLEHFENFMPNIVAISDTRYDEDSERLLRTSCDYNIYCSNYQSNARGTMIMVKKTFPISVKKVETDDDGNRVILSFILYDKSFTVTAVYAPNDEAPEFLNETFRKTFDNNSEFNVILGDFNNAPSLDLDYRNYLTVRNPRTRAALCENITRYKCIDLFRYRNPNRKIFTWKGDGWNIPEARLDNVLVSENVCPFVTKMRIRNAYLTDHKFTVTSIDVHKVKRGKGIWRFSNDLLKDNTYCENVVKTIKETLAKYVVMGQYDNFLQQATPEEKQRFMSLSIEQMQILDYNIDPNLMLEMLLNDIRLESIGYSKAKRKKENEVRNLLTKRIDELNEKKANNDISENEKLELTNKESEYDTYIEEKALQIMKRDRILSKTEGEKAS